MVVCIRQDDVWCKEAEDIINTTDINLHRDILIASLNRHYPYNECRDYDLIVSCTTGTDHIDNCDIPLLSLRGETDFLSDVHATAEHTFALILSLIRKVPFAHKDVYEGNWNRNAWQGTELHGKTLGIIGYGRVGHQVKQIADGFGMICYVTKGIGFTPFKESVEYTLRNSDIVTVHVPLTDETKGMFCKKQFAMMKPTAFFINTSRGDVVDEDALLDALESNIIAGAALDVLCVEPKPDFSDDGLISYSYRNDNLIITPHIGGNTAESRRKTQMFMANKIKKYLEGECIDGKSMAGG